MLLLLLLLLLLLHIFIHSIGVLWTMYVCVCVCEWVICVSQTNNNNRFVAFELGGGDSQVTQRLVEANHIIRAFGNAKTILNPDSNRYGVFVRVAVNRSGNAVAAFQYATFGFQQTRLLINQSDHRNFHIFYYLLKFLDQETCEKHFLTSDLVEYNYLNQTGCLKAKPHDDELGYKLFNQASAMRLDMF